MFSSLPVRKLFKRLCYLLRRKCPLSYQSLGVYRVGLAVGFFPERTFLIEERVLRGDGGAAAGFMTTTSTVGEAG